MIVFQKDTLPFNLITLVVNAVVGLSVLKNALCISFLTLNAHLYLYLYR